MTRTACGGYPGCSWCGCCWNEIRAGATEFAHEWADAAYEKCETQSFYNEFFEILGVRRHTVARYEEHVRRLDDTSGFIASLALVLDSVPRSGAFRIVDRRDPGNRYEASRRPKQAAYSRRGRHCPHRESDAGAASGNCRRLVRVREMAVFEKETCILHRQPERTRPEVRGQDSGHPWRRRRRCVRLSAPGVPRSQEAVRARHLHASAV